jgi:hypothetical protein
MRETPYSAEDVLQQLIEEHPEMLGGDDAPHGQLILVRREAGVTDQDDAGARWSLDHLYVDANGVPTLVEVKRSSDTRSRREVVAQMLDYAANARTSFNAERMAEWLDEAERRRGSSAADALRATFGVDDVDAFWQAVDTNLKAERFRLVFVSDRIGIELRRITEFLNRQMAATEVLAIEVKQYTADAGEHQMIVPRAVGDTAEARAAKRPASRPARLNRGTLLDSIRQRSAPAATATERILDWADHEPRVDTWYTPTSVAINAGSQGFLRILDSGDIQVVLKAFLEYGEPWDHERIEQLVEDLAGIGVHLGPKRNWPTASLEPLADDATRERFLTLVQGVLDTVTSRP